MKNPISRFANAIIDWEWLVLLGLLIPLLFTVGWNGLLLMVIPILWLIRKFATGHFVPPTPYNFSILVLFLALLISLIAVFDINLSFPKITGLILGVAYFFGAVQFSRTYENGKWYLSGFMIIAGGAMAVLGIFGSPFLPLDRWLPIPYLMQLLAPIKDLAGGGVNPNEIAGLLGWILPLFIALVVGFSGSLWRSKEHYNKILLIFMYILLSFFCLILVLTRSRGGIFSVLIAILFMLIISIRRIRWFMLMAALLSILLFGLFNTQFPLTRYLFGSFDSIADLSLASRVEIWSRALYGIADFPLTGMSMNGFREVVFLLYPLFTISPDFDIGHAHNHLLQAGLDLGIPGLIAYLSIWIVCFFLLWQALVNEKTHDNKILLLGLTGSLVAGWSFGILDAIALGARPGFLWWLLLALLVAAFDDVLANNNALQI